MKKSVYVCLLFIVFIGCGTEESKNQSPISEVTYRQISYTVETAIDLNNDGVASTDLLEENEQVLNPQEITFKANNTIIPPYQITTCVAQNGDELMEFVCLTVENYLQPPSYTINGNTVVIDTGLVGELSQDLDTLRFQEFLQRDHLNNYPHGDFNNLAAVSTYVRE
ncbi:hypothetical protein [uncultured Dokdonia sp.]|uniref:hypothetical protein n=1 Tax=uncultured Dokdonia sp. TaxID=575653 RepID=UPI0026256B6D|nr:hypothetical protein [uncultured Dokdonia sp.]